MIHLMFLSMLEVVLITDFFVEIIVGTAFVYDIYFKKIPNYLTAAGYAGMIPIIYAMRGWAGVGMALMGVLAVGIPLFIAYIVGGIGAGDVKLIGLIGGFLGVKSGLIYTVLVLFIGAFIGVVKMLANAAVSISNKEKISGARTGIRFSIPILAGYLVLLISRGGII